MWHHQLATRIVWVLKTACVHASKYSEHAAICYGNKLRRQRTLSHRSQFLFSCLGLADADLAGGSSALCLHVLRLEIIAKKGVTFHCNFGGGIYVFDLSMTISSEA